MTPRHPSYSSLHFPKPVKLHSVLQDLFNWLELLLNSINWTNKTSDTDIEPVNYFYPDYNGFRGGERYPPNEADIKRFFNQFSW
jgi:hypothetical protein